MVRVVLPTHLRTLAGTDREISVNVAGPVTIKSIVDAVEQRYPMLRGTIRDHVTGVRRPMVRFFACGEDLSHDSVDNPLPPTVVEGKEQFFIIGAIAGGYSVAATPASRRADDATGT